MPVVYRRWLNLPVNEERLHMRPSRMAGGTNPFRALQHRSFAWLWASQIVSNLGDSLHIVAIAWWVLESTGSAASMGLVLLCASIPHLVMLPIGGVAGDRLSRARLMLASDLVRASAMGAVAVFAWLEMLNLTLVCAGAAAFGVAGAFFSPAFSALVPELVPEDALPSANALRSLGAQISLVIGPMAAGVMVAFGGTTLAFTIDALALVVSASCIAIVARRHHTQPMASVTTGLFMGVREGVTEVLRVPWLWITIALAGLSNLTLVGPLATSLPLLIEMRFDGDVRVFSLFHSMAAVGAIVAAGWLGTFSSFHRRGLLMYGAWIVNGLMLAALGLPVPLIAAAGAMLLIGFTESMVGLVWMNTLQDRRIVPPDRLGRVVSIDELGSFALLPVGLAFSGLASDRFGPSLVFVMGGAIGAAVIAVGLAVPQIRALD